ncbi:hypothetical protein EN962_30700 [Mesorhizobium sp. M7A.F.Ca.CA.001.09.2.1]|nr:hypothetical protein EN990_25320 [Mesorhizobium sp. M7A.F.Ca.US.005.03.1.1]RUY10550.1 hypothetical protein EN991_27140 [Mesorhizobium sp. M7A.F.Ca.US.005.03.2.1]RUY20183.1 hypothetical protein EN979_36715 [Mesorhizobium sp. M7A.F.Ca.US.001.04.2.1]RUY21442.1 hypothetical protein EN981_35715 [Mesorhizobium sp. M7A.F.Ca.CA.001.13.2.1]RUY38729.1 hypothetical protein EN978_23315 [Mesorhizobium sp. M7A.F.Ca.US.001.04.1.1]RUY55029.1 hypothetical protein EN965_34740 [Mesorhizobium sp. M7A.F.Ca.CA.0
MPLPQTLSSIEMTLECPACGTAFIKPGRWFIAAAHYRCEGCQRLHRLTYPEKVELFDRYTKRLTTVSQRGTTRPRECPSLQGNDKASDAPPGREG